jgi:hypothetical protein
MPSVPSLGDEDQLDKPVTGRCDRADILVLKLRCNRRSASTERQAPTSSKRRPHFSKTYISRRKNLLESLDEALSQE